MEPWQIALIIVCSVLAALVLFVLIPLLFVSRKTLKIAKRIYDDKLVRSTPEKWARECSAPENEEHLRMWNIGLSWRENVSCPVREVSIESDGLKLYAEYFDFGYDRCVIIVPGRCETLMYTYFFADGYKNIRTNFLLADPRAHGKSEGRFSCCGIREADDVLAWAKYAKETLGNNSVILHGICIGASACFMAKEKDTRGYISKIISEGCFTTFYESFRQHIIYEKKPVQPLLSQLRRMMKKSLGIDIKKQSPLKAVKSVNVPVLFIAGRRDLFSVPKKTEELFSACASKKKSLVWFDKGAHSHLRINNMDEYDASVAEFVDA